MPIRKVSDCFLGGLRCAESFNMVGGRGGAINLKSVAIIHLYFR